MLSDTGAFSQLAATRGAAIGTSADETALLGLDVPSLIRAGSEDEPLVTVTNNAETTLDVSVELVAPLESESVSPAGPTSLETGQSVTFTTYIDPRRDGGSDAVAFDINATDNDSLEVDLTRRTDLPTLKRRIIDNTRNNNATFDIQYRIRHVPAFSHMDLTVENTGPNREGEGEEFEEITADEGVISYPSGGGSDGGAEGDTYEFTFEVFDENRGRIIEETVTKVADGDSGDDNDDLGSDDDPVLESFTVTDTTENNTTAFSLDAEISNTEKFEEIVVTFDNPDKRHWNGSETTTETSDSTPPETISYSQGGTEGDRYEITVEVRNTNGLIVDSGSICHVSGSATEVSYPDSAGTCEE